MPYLHPEDREVMDTTINMDSLRVADSPGELNYQLTRYCDQYLYQNAEIGKPPTYKLFNDVIGALECAKLELYRRLVAPYEDVKRHDNGDVYNPEIVTT